MYIILITLLIALFLYLFAIGPKLVNQTDLTQWKGSLFAHRGLHHLEKNTPENSLAAFSAAVENGYGIELDVHVTKDNVPVVFHDFDLLRMCGIDKSISDLTLAELQQYTLDQTMEKIPTLEAVLELVDGKVPLIIEFKSDGIDMSLCSYTQPFLDKYQGAYCIESFNPFVLQWYKKNRPSIIRGQLSKEFKDGNKLRNFILENLLLNCIAQPDFIAFYHQHSDMLSFRICRNFFKVPAIAWTVRTLDELEKAKKDFDSFIFEDFTP